MCSGTQYPPHEDAVHFFLSKKLNLKTDHSHKALPLRAALRSDSMMSLLARNGAPLDAEYQVSSTLRLNILQEAISQGRESITQILLDNGAKVDACSSSHGTALMIALSMGPESIAKLLIQKAQMSSQPVWLRNLALTLTLSRLRFWAANRAFWNLYFELAL